MLEMATVGNSSAASASVTQTAVAVAAQTPRAFAPAQGPNFRLAKPAVVSRPPAKPPPSLRQRHQQRLLVIVKLQLPVHSKGVHHLILREQRMSEMERDSSLSVASVSAPPTAPVDAALVHRGSVQAQGLNFRQARRDAVFQLQADPLLMLPHPPPLLHQRHQQPLVMPKL